MRSKSVLVSVVSSLALVFSLGCGGGGSSSGGNGFGNGNGNSGPKNPPSGGAPGSDVDYPNGHPLSAGTNDPAVRTLESDLITLINAHRVANGQGVLIERPDYNDLARGHSQHMEVGAFFATTNDEGDDLTARLGLMGLSNIANAENITQNHGNAADAFAAWLAVPGEKANLEAANWTHVGTGYHDVGAGTNYWTADFIQE